MEKTSIVLIAIAIFISITGLYWLLTRGYAEKANGKKMWLQWGTRTYYWQGVLYFSGAMTVIIISLLKWFNVFSF